MNTVADLQAEMVRLSRRIDEAQAELVTWSVQWAEKERDYRKGRGIAFAAVRNDKLVAADREAQVDAATADLRHARDHSETMKYSSSQAVQNLRSQLSAVQSIGSAIRAEMSLAGRYET